MTDDKKSPPELKPGTRVPPKPPPSWNEHVRRIVERDAQGAQDSFGFRSFRADGSVVPPPRRKGR